LFQSATASTSITPDPADLLGAIRSLEIPQVLPVRPDRLASMDPSPSESESVARAVNPSRLRSSRDEPAVKAEYAGHADHHITFLHPGYDGRSKQSVLLRLQAFDRDRGGLHFGTALAACRIVAGNSKRGFFTRQRDGPKINLQYDELLREKKYYFYNPDAEIKRYPVYKSFRDWSFPHDDFPSDWAAVEACGLRQVIFDFSGILCLLSFSSCWHHGVSYSTL
jgi:hypothetical protein